MKDLFSLAGKTALITGGSVGIGPMIAEGFVNFGARVYLAARREEALKRKPTDRIRGQWTRPGLTRRVAM